PKSFLRVVNMLPGCIFDSAVMFQRHDRSAGAHAGPGWVRGPIRRAVGYFPREHMCSQSSLFDLNESKTGRKRASDTSNSTFRMPHPDIKPNARHRPKWFSIAELECLRSGLRVYYAGTKHHRNGP